MDLQPFSIFAPDGTRIIGHYQLPDEPIELKGVVQIVHGMGEHGRRYQHVAANLAREGYGVYALDLRGHGKTGRELGSLGYMGPDGFQRAVEDVIQLDGEIRTQHPDLPVFLLGHSMGSVVAVHAFAKLHPRLQGLILSGTVLSRSLDLRFGIWFADQIARRRGDDYVSPILASLVSGPYIRAFRPRRTDYDWLSRQIDVVDAFVADENCGHPLTVGTFRDFFGAILVQFSNQIFEGIRPSFPVLLFSGALDPIGKSGKSVQKFVQVLREHGVQDIQWKLYPEARHEMLNEVNRDEVQRDLISWLQAHTPKAD